MVFVGLSDDKKAYLCFDPAKKESQMCCVDSRDVTFDEEFQTVNRGTAQVTEW
eukprot:CAMPEP_0176000798 /NCGR_PEP_ID=MMETSP0108-20121206/58010_1 /TAXON_ID=195067 ORGANISM="Goniomonas pacifica, Strain CCMP1869" /NCGR_SAMPLE_ID=MMETSP0108 /ASSEMBLY_ACC=CAM_ASM_000204 /LENGTH=52 /DNA_ID=CAMNT_0017333317 /DNA_START=157 /DNA_END=312 /DNA_ORIENTATION=-